MSAQVLSFTSHEETAKNEQVSLDWYSRVSQTAKKAGVPLLESTICRKSTHVRVEASQGSLREVGTAQGFTSLEKFVENVELPDGYSYSWAEWEKDAKAAAIAKAYSISTDFHPQEIIAFCEDATRHLDRRPVDAQEFWHTLVLLDHNRHAARVAEVEARAKDLQGKADGAEAARAQTAREVEQLRGEVQGHREIIGDLPDNFVNRFGTVSNLAELYEAERDRAHQLSNELNLSSADLAVNEALIAELESELQRLKEFGATDRANELQQALEEAAHAKQFVAKLQDRKGDLKQRLADQEKATAVVKGLNGKLSKLVREYGGRIQKLEASQALTKTTNRRLTGALRDQKQKTRVAQDSAQKKEREKAKLMAQLEGARRMKIACMGGLVVTSTFIIAVVAFSFTGLL
ncbi:coiled-coil domain-containing protein [Marinobacter shengliensis]|uniref:hypothetical protein n=1 Tax=Marinobacter shengliensis TaxID=1389223 RepID=UPI001109B8D7|nr:hypothetical protein [Marinobacter shengliensis]